MLMVYTPTVVRYDPAVFDKDKCAMDMTHFPAEHIVTVQVEHGTVLIPICEVCRLKMRRVKNFTERVLAKAME